MRVAASMTAFALSLLFVSCGDGRSLAPVFTPTFVLSEATRHGVVSGEFINAREQPEKRGAETGLILRSGDLVHVIGYDYVRGELKNEEGGYWYLIEAEGKSGWIQSDDLRVFSSFEQAKSWAGSGGGK